MTRHIYKPMLAKEAKSPFSSEDWVFEVKWDGFRAIAYVETSLSIKSRNGKELKANFPELEELGKLGKNIVIDGEIVVLHNGKPDFQALLERGQAVSSLEIQRQTKQSPVVYVVFDILEKDGQVLTELSLLERKKILSAVLKEGTYVVLSDFVDSQGEAYYQSVLERGLEGIVAKRKDSAYEEGLRTGSWLKIKKLRTCDCIIFGYTKGSQAREATFGALLLGVYDAQKNPVYLGKVGTGFSKKTLYELTGKFEKMKTHVEPFTAEAGDVVTWLEPRLVCEVIYQMLTKDNRLRMARFQRLREDKPIEECTLEQFKDTNPNPKLSEYITKRNFQETPEPKGGTKTEEKPIFVVQEHNARRLHWDFRLEKDGVLKSWAVPKGMPEDTKQRHLAVETEDHPLEYVGFEGKIPEGHYGAGTVKIWDKGFFEVKLWESNKIEVTLDGSVLKGRYVLVRLKKGSDNDWLLLKGKEKA
ncbi:MAG: non-homologous end-joining DNA ligase [Candidatus Bathyarchaeota archaeon]|nr:non-homologous end-joining DNA ligase [Candidatus Bathyarchaeota archaeon]